MTFLLIGILVMLLYLAQLLRKVVWLLALVTQNQMSAARIAANIPLALDGTHNSVVGFYEAIRFPWLLRRFDRLEPFKPRSPHGVSHLG